MRGHWISTCLVLLGVVGLAFGSWQLYGMDAGAIDVGPNPYDCGELAVNTTHTMQFTLRNRGRAPVGVLGAKNTCWHSGCGSFGFPAPLTIPAGETRDIALEFAAKSKGSFKLSFPIYTDAPGQAEIELTVVGTVLASRP